MNIKRLLSIHGFAFVWFGWIMYSSHRYIKAGDTNGYMNNLYIVACFIVSYLILTIITDLSQKRFKDFLIHKAMTLDAYEKQVDEAATSLVKMMNGGVDWENDMKVHSLYLMDCVRGHPTATGKAYFFDMGLEFDGFLIVKRKSTPPEEVVQAFMDAKKL